MSVVLGIICLTTGTIETAFGPSRTSLERQTGQNTCTHHSRNLVFYTGTTRTIRVRPMKVSEVVRLPVCMWVERICTSLPMIRVIVLSGLATQAGVHSRVRVHPYNDTFRLQMSLCTSRHYPSGRVGRMQAWGVGPGGDTRAHIVHFPVHPHRSTRK